MEADPPNKVLVATVSDLPTNQLIVVKPTTTKEDKHHGAMSEEAADNTSVPSLESTEELHGVTVTQENQLEYTLDAGKSSITAKQLVRLPLRKRDTNPVVKATKWPETGARRVAMPTLQESSRDTDITDLSEAEKSPEEDR